MSESDKFQYPVFQKLCGNGQITVKTYIGSEEFNVTERVSPRIADETRNKVWEILEERIRQHVESLKPA